MAMPVTNYFTERLVWRHPEIEEPCVVELAKLFG